jgi:4-hydroxy 2-oxovalerate aldolase
MEMTETIDAKGTWLTYRPDIKIQDCTIRDGGLINDHRFDDRFFKAVYETDIAAGVSYMEIGYKSSKKIFTQDKYGKWKYCDENHIRELVGDNTTSLKLCAMADTGRTDYHEDILSKKDSVLDLIRVACYINQIPAALDIVKDAVDKGYETTLQLMAISIVKEKELQEALDIIAKSPVTAVFIVDSFGALYSEQIRYLVNIYQKALEGTGKEVGIHAHNNQQLAYANTIEALILGANRLDATINGMGRGAGNCPLENLIGFLKNPAFKLRPVLKCIQEYVQPMEKEMEWGAKIPYMITGMLNMHPKEAIAMRSGDKRDDLISFYDQITHLES